MPPKPTLVDFFTLRFTLGPVSHVLQSATRAMKQGHPEETTPIFAALINT
jgi:predicted HD phosphohydrolase